MLLQIQNSLYIHVLRLDATKHPAHPPHNFVKRQAETGNKDCTVYSTGQHLYRYFQRRWSSHSIPFVTRVIHLCTLRNFHRCLHFS